MSDEQKNKTDESTGTKPASQTRGTKNRITESDAKKIITPEYQMKHNYLLVIAVDRYRDKEIPNLKNCLNDIEDLLEILTTHYFFNRDNIRFLRSRNRTSKKKQKENEARETKYAALVEEATHDNIITQFKNLAKTMTPADNLIICYSGHGIYDEDFDEGYWIPSDGRLDKNASYIENGTIRTALNAIDTHHTVLISDSCYSGTLFSVVQTKSLTVPEIYHYPSRWGITAGRKEPVSDGALGENSPFAKELLDILGQKQEIWISTLINEIIKRITDRKSDEKQSPVGEALSFIKGHKNGQFVFMPRMATEEDYWITAWRENKRKGYYAFLARYPNGVYEEASLDALNVFATNENRKPAFTEEALATYRLLTEQLPKQAQIYTSNFLKGETRSVLSTTAIEMYQDMMIHYPEAGKRELKAFILLGDNFADLDILEPKYLEAKGNTDQLQQFFQQEFDQYDYNPYLGLEPYIDQNSKLFFGRKAAIQTLADKLIRAKLVLISAPAYAGKTSVVQAGVFPLLRKSKGFEMLKMSFKEDMHNCSKDLKKFIDNIEPDKRQIFFIDTYEQLFSQAIHRNERQACEKLLLKLLAADSYPKLKIIICLRSNFEEQFRSSSFGRVVVDIEHTEGAFIYRLPSLNKKEWREILWGPMWRRSFEYESEKFIDDIIDDVQDLPNALPLLSFTLQSLYNKSDKKTRLIKQQYYSKSGKVRGALDTMADRALYSSISPPEQRILRHIIIRMTEPLRGGSYVSRAVTMDEFTHPIEVEEQLIKQTLEDMKGSQFFVVSRDEEGIVRIKAKDLLINSWSKCRQWIREFGSENLNLQSALRVATQSYYNPSLTDDYGRTESIPTTPVLWDNDDRLTKIINQIMYLEESAEEGYILYKLIQEIRQSLAGNERTQFDKLFNRISPVTLEDYIVTGASTRLLSAFLNTRLHWLNRNEARFIEASWGKKVQAFMAVKKERDEALAAKKQTEILLHKSAVQTQAFKAKYQEQTRKDLLFIQKGFKPNLHLILVGIDDYPVTHWKLNGCVADVQAINKAFTSQAGKLYAQVFSHILTDKDATKENILKIVTEVKAKAGILDFVFVYLSGLSSIILSENDKEKTGVFFTSHPAYKEENFDFHEHYFLKNSRDKYNPVIILSGRELCTALMSFKCKVILTLDICHGADFLSTLIEANHSDNPEHLSHYVFALSGTTNEGSKEIHIDGKRRGAFSYALTNSITTNEADLDNNGVLYLDELLRYTSEKVSDQNVLAVVPSIMTNIPLFQLGDDFNLPEVEILLSGHITDDAVIESINIMYGENNSDLNSTPTR